MTRLLLLAALLVLLAVPAAAGHCVRAEHLDDIAAALLKKYSE